MALALVVFDNNKTKFVPQDQAERLWWVHEGGEKPRTRAQAAYIAHVKRVFLNRKTAPAAYLEKHSLEQESKRPTQQRMWWDDYENY